MRKWCISGASALILLAQTVLAPWAVAAPSPTPTPSAAPSGQALEISPPVIELQAAPGQTITANIRVRNVATGELIAKGKADDFGAGAKEDGQPKLLLDETGATRFSLKYWIPSVPDLRLAPQELKTAVVTINVPANAEPGGHFGVVRFTAVPPSLEGTGVALSASVGALILLRISGSITESLSLASFNSGRLEGPSENQTFNPNAFFETGPIDFNVRLKNSGTVHEKPQGTIIVKNLLGRTVGTIDVNTRGGNVLPDSVRKFEQTLSKKQLLGHYTANLRLKYANGSKSVTAATGFWVIPWKLLLLILLGLVIIGYLGRLGVQHYNRYIIAQSRRH